MSGELDDYGNLLSDSLTNTNTNSNSLFSDNYKVDLGNTGVNTSNVNTSNVNQNLIDANNVAGNTSNNYVMPGAYTMDANGVKTPVSDLAGLTKWLADNKGLITAGGALLGLTGANNNQTTPTGYQGGIPLLGASRTMVTAPPTRAQGYRPGAGGVNYGGDVTYTRLAKGTDPWVNLSGTSGTLDGANLTGLTSNLAKTLTTGKIDTVTGGNKTDTVVGGGGNDTVKADTRSDALRYAETSGMGDMQFYNNINQWVLDHPYASRNQIDTAMKAINMNNVDLQTALGMSNFSDATKYALTHGSGLAELNNQLISALEKNPYLSNKEIQDAQKQFGISDEDIARAMTGLNSSAGKEYAIVHDMGLDQFYKNILDYERENHTPAEIAEAMRTAGVDQRDINAVHAYATAKGYAEGGMAGGRYLQGGTDGMADKIPAQIGRDQPAALSHGEFVVPADVVSHLGNGNSDAGAKKLYQMMDKIRMARTGNKKQGKKINPDKFMPGGLAQAYAEGGSVKHFLTGGSTTLPTGTTGTESSLSNWAGDYTTNMLGQGQALANLPYTPYMGQLTAGESPLQTSAFNTAAGLTTPTGIGTAATTAGDIATSAQKLSYSPTTFTNQYTAPTAYTPTTSSFSKSNLDTYMNPYIDKILAPQLEEARRQSQITQQQNAGKMTQAGAFGGGRQAILDAETQRNLGTTQAGITGAGYNTAYQNALSQFNADQARKMQENQFGAQQGMTSAQLGAQYGLAGQQAGEQSKQYGAGYGLQGLQTGLQAAQAQGNLANMQGQAGLANLNAQLTAGGQQRGIEAEGISADKAAFEEARANPYKMVQFQQSLLQGLPLAAQSYNIAQPSTYANIMSGATTAADLLDILTGKTPAKKA